MRRKTLSKQEMRPGPASGIYYTPKWDIWINGIVWQAVYNVINSYNVLETVHIEGIGVPKVPDDLFVRRVLVLFKLIRKGWSDNEFDPMLAKVKKAQTDHKEIDYWDGMELFGEILDLFHRRGYLKFKPPLDPAD